MSKAYGFIEITGVVAAINALDIMCKTADVELASWERKLGGRLVTLIVEGDVSAVNEAVEAAVANAIKKPASYAVIARPHEEIVKLVELSASRWKKKIDCEDKTRIINNQFSFYPQGGKNHDTGSFRNGRNQRTYSSNRSSRPDVQSS